MDKTALVNVEIDQGAEVLRILDDANLRIKVAAWCHLDGYGTWRLILSSKELEAAGIRGGIRLVLRALHARQFPIELTPAFMIFKMSDPFIRDLRRIFGRTASVQGMRLGGQMIGNRYVEDGYVYRIE